jgi:hypothetical protein
VELISLPSTYGPIVLRFVVHSPPAFRGSSDVEFRTIDLLLLVWSWAACEKISYEELVQCVDLPVGIVTFWTVKSDSHSCELATL